MREGLDGAACSEIRAADADYHHEVHPECRPVVADGLAVFHEAFRNVHGNGFPAEEIVAGALFALEFIEGGEGLLHVCVILFLFYEGVASPERNLYHIVGVLDICKFNNFRLYLS